MLFNSIALALVVFASRLSIVHAEASCESVSAALENLSTAGNNSYFLKWRPKFHVQAPNSWMNGLLPEKQ